MMNRKSHLNLAASPARNRRLFHLLVLLLGALLALTVSFGGATFFKYRQKNRDARRALMDVREKTRIFQQEEKRFARLNQQSVRDYQAQTDLINSMIIRKRFSWVKMLSSLEEALPDSCYILSLAPQIKKDATMEIRLKAVVPTLEEFLLLYQRLHEQQFQQIRIISEAAEHSGRLTAEIVFVYE